MPPTRPLDFPEMRVLGVLLEKEQATPDAYPMTIRAVVAGANQKSNREPVTELSETEVVEALDRLRRDALAWRSEGARSERWEHLMDRRWGLDAPRKAVMTLLLLRGPQTAGELKSRAERLHRFAATAEVEGTLRALAAGDDALVRELPRRPGQRETRWMAIVGSEEAEAARHAFAPPAADEEAEEPAEHGPTALARLAALEEEQAALRREVASLRDELDALRRALGEDPED